MYGIICKNEGERRKYERISGKKEAKIYGLDLDGGCDVVG